MKLSAPYLSDKWVRQLEKHYGPFSNKGKEGQRRTTKVITFSAWLKKHELYLDVNGDSVSIVGAMPKTESCTEWSVSISRCSGGAYYMLKSCISQIPSHLRKQIYSRTMFGSNPEKREASVNTIIAGMQELVAKLNSHEAENVILSQMGLGPSKVLESTDKERQNGHIRYNIGPSMERWTTEIVLDPENLKSEVAECVKSCVNRKIPIHIKGFSKYVPDMNDLTAIAPPELIIGSLAEEYKKEELSRKDEIIEIDIF